MRAKAKPPGNPQIVFALLKQLLRLDDQIQDLEVRNDEDSQLELARSNFFEQLLHSAGSSPGGAPLSTDSPVARTIQKRVSETRKSVAHMETEHEVDVVISELTYEIVTLAKQPVRPDRTEERANASKATDELKDEITNDLKKDLRQIVKEELRASFNNNDLIEMLRARFQNPGKTIDWEARPGGSDSPPPKAEEKGGAPNNPSEKPNPPNPPPKK